MARLLPKAPEGPFEERALDGPGQPSVACPKASVRGESRVSLGKSRPLPAARPGRLGWVGLALRSCAPFLLLQTGGKQPCTRRRTSCERLGLLEEEGDEVPRRWRAPRRPSSSRRGRCGRVRCALWPACPQQQLPAVARARRSRSRCSSHSSRSARPGAEVSGVRAPALPPNSGADFLLPLRGLSTGEVVEIESEVRAPRPAPALARVQRPRPYAGPIAHACAALRPHSTLPLPSPPLPCPRRVAPHTPSPPPAVRARSLGPRAR